MAIFPLAPDQSIAQMWSNGVRGRSMASLILVSNVVGELQPKRTLAASHGFLVYIYICCFTISHNIRVKTEL